MPGITIALLFRGSVTATLGRGLVEVPTEAAINNEIALNIRDLIIRDVKRTKGKVYVNGIGVEVTRSEKEERVPDIVVISKEGAERVDRETHVITLDMPAPLLVVEVVSPSSVKIDLEDKPFEMMSRGVGEYASIDWRKEIVQVWSCTEDGKNYNFSVYRSGERVVLKSFPALVVTVDEMILKE